MPISRCRVVGIFVLKQLGDGVEIFYRCFELRADAIAHKALQESTNADLGLVISASVADLPASGDGFQPAEDLKAVTGRSLADLQSFDDLVEGQRLRVSKQKSVNLTDGGSEAEGAREGGKVVNQCQLR